MKTNYFVIAAFAAIALFASCDKDNNRTNPEKDTGKATSMKVSLTFPNVSQTRATADLNATDNEAQVNTVDVFIYYTSSGAFASHAHLTAADFTQRASTGSADVYEYTATAKIPTTTGAKSVFAGINLPASVVDALKNRPASTLASVEQIMTRAELAGATNFAMFSVQAVNSIFVEDDAAAANNITLRCQRLVAKVTVETANDMVQAGVPGTLSNLEFAINNFNTKLFMLQGAPEYRKDPNWASGSFVQTDFLAAVNADYAPILDRKVIASPAIGDYTPRYAAENTSEGKLKKEITRVTVRATFIPETVWQGTTGNFNENSSHGIIVPQTFYAVTPSVTEGTFYFFTESIADEFAAERGGTKRTYTNGYCYWDIFLGKNPDNIENKWDVLRNDFYKCNITKIVAPGRPDPEVPDPDVTPEDDTSITASIDILFWHTPVISNYVLE